jgi:lysozyme family protein
MTDFERAFEKTLKLEGGGEISDDSSDAGGLTKWGISQRAYPDLDIKNLTKEQAKEIYKKDYWDRVVSFPNLDSENEYVRVWWKIYDIAVNMGVQTAVDFREKVFGLGWEYGLYELCELQMKRYVQITVNRPANLTFLKGWTKRAFDKGTDL